MGRDGDESKDDLSRYSVLFAIFVLFNVLDAAIVAEQGRIPARSRLLGVDIDVNESSRKGSNNKNKKRKVSGSITFFKVYSGGLKKAKKRKA